MSSKSTIKQSKNFLTFYPNYTDADFERLITELKNRGYGWLRQEGVKPKLQELSRKKVGFFSLLKKKIFH